MPRKVVIPIVTVMLILAGCGPARRKPLQVCPGKDSAAEALSALRLHSQNVTPLRATGRCRLEYYTEEKRKPHKEAFPVWLWVNPPAEICLHGDVAFDPRGLVLGSNNDEFWLSIRPKISSYWRGRWSRNNNVQQLILSPRVVLEAIGIAAADGDAGGQGDWSLSNEGPFDVLTRRSGTGLTVKRIYIHNCDYLVRKIEYLNEFGQVEVVAELDKYKEVVEGFSTPTSIKVVKRTGSGRDDSVRITLKSVKPYEFTKKQLEFLFKPRPGRFKHVYEVVRGRSVEQPQ
ncbi:MAG: hypothetical protein KAY65_00805 [Planctomycetes bacterium]|nr:hypothetical protein [Planctomycetota bacterium]